MIPAFARENPCWRKGRKDFQARNGGFAACTRKEKKKEARRTGYCYIYDYRSVRTSTCLFEMRNTNLVMTSKHQRRVLAQYNQCIPKKHDLYVKILATSSHHSQVEEVIHKTFHIHIYIPRLSHHYVPYISIYNIIILYRIIPAVHQSIRHARLYKGHNKRLTQYFPTR